jgi:hypothetical protein
MESRWDSRTMRRATARPNCRWTAIFAERDNQELCRAVVLGGLLRPKRTHGLRSGVNAEFEARLAPMHEWPSKAAAATCF